MWESMTCMGKSVVIVLALMSVWSLTIAIERLWKFQMAKKESLQVAVGITVDYAIHVIYRDKVMDLSNKVALALAQELEARVGRAYAATVRDELVALLSDLPSAQLRPRVDARAQWRARRSGAARS